MWGIGITAGYFYALRNVYSDKTFSDFATLYPHLIGYQCNCLSCRIAMYIFSILLCKQLGIHIIAEGARKSQLFAIEQDEMIHEFRKLLQEFDIELLTSVHELNCDLEREVLLMIRGILPKVEEPQCWIGAPMKEPLSEDEVKDVVRFFKQELLGPTRALIKESEKIPLDHRGRMF